MLKYFVLCAIVVFYAVPVRGQVEIVWEKTFDDPESVEDFQLTNSGGYILTGGRTIVVTDEAGNTVRESTVPSTSFYSIDKTTDGHYILGGGIWDYDYMDDMYILKVDINLDQIWDNSFRMYNDGGTDIAYCVKQANDGGFFFCGDADYHFGIPMHDDYARIVKVDALGNYEWSQKLGIGGYGDDSFHLEQTAEGTLYVSGHNNDDGHAWLKNYGSGEVIEYWGDYQTCHAFHFFQQTSENNLVFTGFICEKCFQPGLGSYNVWLFKTDMDGNQIWSRQFGGPHLDIGYCVRQTLDGHYIIAGETKSFGAGGSDPWVIQTDQHGNKIWGQTFGTSNDNETAKKIREIAPDEYIVCGKKDGKGWLAKLSRTYELATPGLVEPVPDKVGIGANLWLNWAGTGTADAYDVQVDWSQDFDTPEFSQNNMTGSRCYVPSLYHTLQYYWRVRAKKGATITDWSDPRKFIVMGAPPVTVNSPSGYVLTYLETGDQYYIDRSYIVHSVPDQLKNYLWIKTANDDKNVTSNNHLTFTLNQGGNVYVGYDNRATSLPAWLADGFQDTGQIIGVSDELDYLNVYKKYFSSGTVTLGGNKAGGGSGAKSNYTVFMDIMPSFFTQTNAGLESVHKGNAVWGDYDSDGDLDLFLTGENGSLVRIAQLYQNDDGGGFHPVAFSFTGVRASAAEFGDYDNDGDLDILYCGQTDNNVSATRLYRNDGSNNFTAVAPNLADVYSGDVGWGDFDNDGDLDILLMGYSSNSGLLTKLYENQGNDTFVEHNAGLKNLKAGTVNWFDYDLDKDMDILLTGEDDASLPNSLLYRNNGDGTFTHTKTFENILLGCTAIGDYDDDGDPDIFQTGYTVPGQNNRLYRNDGNGNFRDMNPVLPDIVLGSADWGDYDNDGDLDLLVTGMDTLANRIARVYTNTGNAKFNRLRAGLPGVFTGHAAWGDYDGDNDLDILLCGLDAGDNRVTDVYRNHNQIKNTIPQAPTDLIVTPSTSDTSFTLSWSAATDHETPQSALTYNLIIGTQSCTCDILSPMSTDNFGIRQIPASGNTGHNTSWTLKHLPEGEYYWSVQAIDNAHAGSRFAGEATFTFIPVPVELAAFTVEQQGGQVLISWGTMTETTNRGFNVYRSRQNDGEYFKINAKIISGAGTTSREKQYEYTDTDVEGDHVLYYKLEQIDLDGRSTFYGPRQITVTSLNSPEKYVLRQNYPNPFNSETWINWELPETADVQMTIYNIKGERIDELCHRRYKAGVYKVKWNGRSKDGIKCPSGIYWLKLQAGGFTDIKKMVLTR